MAIFQKKKTTAYALMQSAKGSPATITAASAIDPVMESTFVQPRGEQIDRGLIRGSRWPSRPAAGGRWGEGSLTLELRGSGTAGTAPEFAPLLETLLGTEQAVSASTVTADSGTVSGFESAGNYPVGSLVRVAIGAGYEVRRIATQTGSGPYEYTVQRDFSLAPADGAVIAAGVTYFHEGSEAIGYMTLDQYLDGLKLLCTDAVCESLAVNVSERAVIQGTFGVRSLGCAESAATDALTPVYDDSAPLIGTECNLVFGGTALEMKSLEFNVTTRRARGGINSTGYSELPFSGTFEATATMAPWVEDAAPITGFFDGTQANAELTKGDTEGNILHIELVGLQRTGPEIGEDEGDFTWSDPLAITGGVYIGFF